MQSRRTENSEKNYWKCSWLLLQCEQRRISVGRMPDGYRVSRKIHRRLPWCNYRLTPTLPVDHSFSLADPISSPQRWHCRFLLPPAAPDPFPCPIYTLKHNKLVTPAHPRIRFYYELLEFHWSNVAILLPTEAPPVDGRAKLARISKRANPAARRPRPATAQRRKSEHHSRIAQLLRTRCCRHTRVYLLSAPIKLFFFPVYSLLFPCLKTLETSRRYDEPARLALAVLVACSHSVRICHLRRGIRYDARAG